MCDCLNYSKLMPLVLSGEDKNTITLIGMSMGVKVHPKQVIMEKQVFLLQFYYQHNKKRWSALVLEILMDSFNGSAPHFFLLENITRSIFCEYNGSYFYTADILRSHCFDPKKSQKLKMKGDGFLFQAGNTLDDSQSSAIDDLLKWSLN